MLARVPLMLAVDRSDGTWRGRRAI